MEKIDTLVFEGGSVKGLAYVGALKVLDIYFQENYQKLFLDQIHRVAGTSAGSIMALLIALGLNLKQISFIMQNTSFKSFADKSWYAHGYAGKGAAIYRNGYLCEGLKFLQWVEEVLETYTGKKTTTFAELKKQTSRDLHVYAVRLNDSKVITFNADKTPDVAVGLAIRMSMSIPVFFKPVRVDETLNSSHEITEVKLNEANGTGYYVDGGIKFNYPYALIKETCKLNDEQILGFKVDSHDEILTNAVNSGNEDAKKYLQPLYTDRTKITAGYGIHLIPYVLTALMSHQEDAHNKNKDESDRTIRCWDCNISTFDFDLKQPKIDGLLASGAQSATTFISKMMEKEFKHSIVVVETISKEAFTKEELKSISKFSEKEGKRVNEAIYASSKSAKSAGKIEPEELEYIESLKTDMERLQDNFKYHIDNVTNIEGKVIGEAKIDVAGVSNLPVDLQYFKKAIDHVQEMTKMGIKNVTNVKQTSVVGSLNIGVANLEFTDLPEQTSFLSRYNMYSPKPLNLLTFVKNAENFSKALQQNGTYNLDQDVIQQCEELDQLLTSARETMKQRKEVTKEQRQEIREQIKSIEEMMATIDQANEEQKKTIPVKQLAS